MVRVYRPAELPGELGNKGVEAAQGHCSQYETGIREFNFKEHIYNDSRVVVALLEMQHHKCLFCEQIIGKDGDVEHFRPKKGFCQEKGEKLEKPGYFWLAYSWTNLFRACMACNQRWKENLFPLENPESRCRSHSDNLDVEKPLLIDPTLVDPELLIGWREEVPYPIGNDTRARKTIELLGLREVRNLELSRLQHLNDVKRYLKIIRRAAENTKNEDCQRDAIDAREGIQEKLLPSAPFLAMTRAYLASQNFLP